ncbi:MAG TPA: cytochrome c, partial [Candidatus Binatia bacterium]|nr:cytochrome c [Candidatus Binatia bacterium]
MNAAVFFLLLACASAAHAQTAKDDLVARGQYIFSLAGGCACHTEPKGTPNAGGRVIPLPFAKIYSTNITSDKETGLGNWTDQQIRDAMVKGVRPNGERLLPVMPYEAYSGMAEDDMKALIAYLRTLKPVRKETVPLYTWVPFYRPIATFFWSRFVAKTYTSVPKPPAGGVERGRYIADHISICGDCHTPRNSMGIPQPSLYLAGTKKAPPLNVEVPNITPDKETGIGDWSRDSIADLIQTGTKPDLDNVQGLMAEVIEAGYKNMKREDVLAITDY